MRSGIKGLDEAMGGFPDKGLVVVAGGPGIGKTVMAGQFLYCGASFFGERGVYVSFSESKEEFYSNMLTLGMDFKRLEEDGLFQFLSLTVLDKNSFTRCFEMTIEAVSSMNARRVVCDSITAATCLMEDPEVRNFVQILRGLMRNMGSVCLMVCETSSEAKSEELGPIAFMADAVILMRWKNEGVRLREMEILKVRGFPVEKGLHEFDVDRKHGGVWVISPPRSIPGGNVRVVKTGIDWLDQVIGGGLRHGSFTLIKGEVGSGKTCFCAQIAASMVAGGRRCVYVSTEEGENAILNLIEKFGFNFEEFEGRLKALSIVPEEYGVQRLYSFFDDVACSEKPDVIIVDSLTPFKHTVPQSRFYMFLRFLQLLAKANDIIFVATSPLFLIEEAIEADSLGLFDNVLMLRHASTNGTPHKMLFIVKVRGSDHRKEPIRLEITSKGLRPISGEGVMATT